MQIKETGGGGLLGFFVRRWRGQVPLDLLFWRDMVVVGTLINLCTTFASLMALGFKADLAVAMLVFFHRCRTTSSWSARYGERPNSRPRGTPGVQRPDPPCGW